MGMWSESPPPLEGTQAGSCPTGPARTTIQFRQTVFVPRTNSARGPLHPHRIIMAKPPKIYCTDAQMRAHANKYNIDRSVILRVALNHAKAINDDQKERRLNKIDAQWKKVRARRDKQVRDFESKLLYIEAFPSRRGVDILAEIIKSPYTRPLQKTKAGAIMLRWMSGDISDGRRGRRSPRRRD
jgi:hypothetical protein